MTGVAGRPAGKEAFLMGIDIGAGSLKTMIVSSAGRVCGSAAVDIATHSPKPRWSEQDPQDWWKAVCTTVPLALAEAAVAEAEKAQTAVLNADCETTE